LEIQMARTQSARFIESLLLEAITHDRFEHEAVLSRALEVSLIAGIFQLVAGVGAPVRPATPDSESLREPLTDAETRVLRYLPTNLSKQEIADELFVSVHTVKTHAKHLYAKLEVHSRRQAVSRAVELGLLTRHRRSAERSTPYALGITTIEGDR
jgi:ATP/maltotriose-dependent transcriptional regulator MalT